MTPDISTPLPRRTIAKGAAWAAPVITIAAAAPVASASGPTCQGTTSWDSLTLGDSPSLIQFLPSAITANLVYGKSSAAVREGNTGKVARQGGAPWNFIILEMNRDNSVTPSHPLTQGDYVDLTITFSEPVENLGLKIHDIDTIDYSWKDEVILTPAPTSYTLGSHVIGAGTSASPFRANRSFDSTTGSGDERVTLEWAGPIQSVRIRYRAGITGGSLQQWIAVGDISFNSCVTP